MGLAAFVIIIIAVGLEIVGQVCFKRGASSVGAVFAAQSIPAYWVAILGNAWVLTGLSAYAVEIVVGIAALSLAPLSVVYPLLNLSYCGVALASHLFFGERLGAQGVVAILLITLGAALVSLPNG